MNTVRAVLSISLFVSLSATDTELSSSWKQRPPARDIPPSVALCLSLSTVVSLQSEPPSCTSPLTHVTDNTPGSDTDHLMTGASLSLSESMPILSTSHFILLPSNQWSRASKQKSNRLHSWLFMSFGNLSHQVRGFGSCTESALLTLAEHFTLTWCCSAFRAWRTVGWTPFTTSVKSLFIYSIWIDTSCFSVHVHTDKQP